LAKHGAIQTELEEDPRIAKANKSTVNFNKNAAGGFVGKGAKRDSDDEGDSDDDED